MSILDRLRALIRPEPVPPSTKVRNAVIAGAATAGAASAISAVAYFQARVVASDEAYVATPLDAQLRGDDPEEVWTRIAWLGDSLAAGMGAISPDLSLPHLVASGRGRHTRLHVFAHPGATSRDVVRDQLPALRQLRHGLAEIGQRVDAVGVTVGANDISAFTPRHRFRHNVERIVRATGGAPVVLVSIPQLNDAVRLPRLLRTIASARAVWLDLVLRRIARSRDDVFYVSVRKRPPWVRRRDLQNFLSADRFHPSGAGYALWAERVAEGFEQALSPGPIT